MSGKLTTAMLTDYITTRWYRAPEVMYSWQDYSAAIDVWAVGCIFAEMIIGTPLFKSVDEIHQVQLIIGTLGPKAKEDLETLMEGEKLEVSLSE